MIQVFLLWVLRIISMGFPDVSCCIRGIFGLIALYRLKMENHFFFFFFFGRHDEKENGCHQKLESKNRTPPAICSIFRGSFESCSWKCGCSEVWKIESFENFRNIFEYTVDSYLGVSFARSNPRTRSWNTNILCVGRIGCDSFSLGVFVLFVRWLRLQQMLRGKRILIVPTFEEELPSSSLQSIIKDTGMRILQRFWSLCGGRRLGGTFFGGAVWCEKSMQVWTRKGYLLLVFEGQACAHVTGEKLQNRRKIISSQSNRRWNYQSYL